MSFTDALRTASTPRVIRPASGIYTLRGALYVHGDSENYDYLIIDGTGRDITITRGGLYINACKHVTVKNVRFRDPGGLTMCLRLSDCSNVLVSQCSFSGQVLDDTLGSKNANNVTVEWCLFSGNHYSYHPYGEYLHNITVHHCLFYDCDARSVGFGDYYDTVGDVDDGISNSTQFVNNTVAAWHDYATGVAGRAQLDAVGNVFIPGPYSNAVRGEFMLHSYHADRRLYVAGNIGPNNRRGNLPNWAMVTDTAGMSGIYLSQSKVRQWPALRRETDALSALADVLAYAGSQPRDLHDQRVVNDVSALWRQWRIS